MPAPAAHEARRQWMRVLAAASADELAAAWRAQESQPTVEEIRGPQTGLVMVRGRIGAGGDRFNLGEATVTRTTVRLSGGPLTQDTVGTAYVLGTDLDHGRLAAVFDGLLADEKIRPQVLATVVEPLAQAQHAREDRDRAAARDTKVDFFTVAREHS